MTLALDLERAPARQRPWRLTVSPVDLADSKDGPCHRMRVVGDNVRCELPVAPRAPVVRPPLRRDIPASDASPDRHPTEGSRRSCDTSSSA